MKCNHIKDNWEQCNAFSMKWTAYCFLHNPDIPQEEKKEVQSKGGKAGIKQLNTAFYPPVIIKDTCDISQLLIDTINQVRSTDMDIKTANCIWFLCNHLMKAYEITTLEKKLDAIKQSLASK